MTALRYYFDLVCPYSYILTPEVEQAEDEGLVEIEWLPFAVRPAEGLGAISRPEAFRA